ncbi:MAG: Rha family transcriptional regulator, partial [Desulfovibrio sp.]|nr:Rha family transcriptional regulator [Desulfovibrio sp.]
MATETLPQTTISVEFLPDGETPTVSSLEVARHFQKKHKHVLDEIKRIQSITPKSFSEPNFRPAEYTDEQGKPRPCYRLTRDGFSLLAMGFTGSAAIRWKLKYIEAFNCLEAAVLDNARAAALAEGVKAAFSLSAKDRALLNKIIAYKKRGLYTSEIAKLMDTHEIKVGMLTTQARRMGLLPENAGKHR